MSFRFDGDRVSEDRSTEDLWQEDASMQALRGTARLDLRPEREDAFRARVLRRHKVSAGRSGLAYWAPALVGAMVAALAVLVVLQLLTRESGIEPANVPGAEAKLDTWQGHFPELEPAELTAMP